MNAASQSSDSSQLRDTLALLRRGWKVIVLCTVLVAAAAAGLSALQEKQYEASASLLFRDPGLDQKLFGSTFFSPSTDPTREAATNVKLVSLKAVAKRTAAKVGRGLTDDDVQKKVAVAAEGQSDVVSITATDPDPAFAATLANTFADEYIAFRREADRSKVDEARELVNSQIQALPAAEVDGARGRSLRDRAEQLEILASLQTGNAETVERAEAARHPSSPKPVRNGILGAFLGALLGLALTLLFSRLDRRLHSSAEAQAAYGHPVLATVQQSDALPQPGHTPGRLPAAESEAFRMLLANLRYFDVDMVLRSVMITSAGPGDGKTTVSANLAVTAASTGARVLLIEADLRHPTLSVKLGIPSAEGLSSILSGHKTLEEAVVAVETQQGSNGTAPAHLDVVFAGSVPPNPTALLESGRMAALLTEAEERYDLVIIDTPPVSVVSDAIPLLRRVSGIVVVARAGQSTRDAATHLRDQLANWHAPVLGLVVNGVDSEAYTYGYGDT